MTADTDWVVIISHLDSISTKSLWIIFKRPNMFYDRTVEYVLKDSIYVHHEFNKSKHMSDFQGSVRLRFGRDCLGFIWVIAVLRDKNSTYAYFFHFRTLIIDVWLWNMISLDIIEKYFQQFLCINWFTMGWNLFLCNIFMTDFSSIEIAIVSNWRTSLWK